MNKFEKYNLDLSEENKIIIINYLKNIKSFIISNKREIEDYEKIKTKVFEKLSMDKDLDKDKIKKILNEIGIEEKILKNNLSSDKPKKNSFDDYFDLNLLGLFKKHMFLIIGLFVFLLFLIFSDSILTPIFLLTIVGVFYFLYNEYKEESNGNMEFNGLVKFVFKKLKNLFIIIFKFLKNYILPFLKKLFKSFYSIFSNLAIFIKKIIIFLGKYSIKLFKTIFSMFGYIFLGISIILLCIIPILGNGLKIGNINYVSAIPVEMMAAYFLFCLTLIIISVYIITRKLSLMRFSLVGLSLALTISLIFMGGTKLYNKHSYEGKYIQEYEIKTDNNNLTINKSNLDIYGKMYQPINLENFQKIKGIGFFNKINTITNFGGSYKIDLIASKDDKIKIKVINKIFFEKENDLKRIENNLSNFDSSIEKDNLILKVQKGNIFKQIQGFIPIIRNIEIYIPNNMLISFNGFGEGNFSSKEIYKCAEGVYNIGNIDNEINCIGELKETNTSKTDSDKTLLKEDAIEEYLSSESDFLGGSGLFGSNKSCVFSELDDENSLFPINILSYCVEYKVKNNKYIQLRESFSPVLIDYPNEISSFSIDKFSHKILKVEELKDKGITELIGSESIRDELINKIKNKISKDILKSLSNLEIVNNKKIINTEKSKIIK